MKIIKLTIALLTFMLFMHKGIEQKYVEFTCLDTYHSSSITLLNSVQLINSEDDLLYNQLYLGRYGVDLNKSTVVLTNGDIKK